MIAAVTWYVHSKAADSYEYEGNKRKQVNEDVFVRFHYFSAKLYSADGPKR